MLAQRRATLADLPRMWNIRTAAVRLTCASHYTAYVIDAMCATPPPPSMQSLIGAGGAFVMEEENHMLGYAMLDIHTGEIDAVLRTRHCFTFVEFAGGNRVEAPAQPTFPLIIAECGAVLSARRFYCYPRRDLSSP